MPPSILCHGISPALGEVLQQLLSRLCHRASSLLIPRAARLLPRQRNQNMFCTGETKQNGFCWVLNRGPRHSRKVLILPALILLQQKLRTGWWCGVEELEARIQASILAALPSRLSANLMITGIMGGRGPNRASKQACDR